MESYAKHFDLNKDIVFNAAVNLVVRNKDNSRWRIDLTVDGINRIEEFDKIAFCHGYQNKPKLPVFEGREQFEGEFIHGQAFKEYASLVLRSLLPY